MPSKKKTDVGLEIAHPEYETYITAIKQKVDSVMTNYIQIGHYLNMLSNNELYKQGGYQTINELAKTEFNLSDTTIKNSMGVANKYCDEQGNIRTEFSNYKFSALVELLPVEEQKVLVEFKPEMTVKEIREKKKQSKPEIINNSIDDIEDNDDEDNSSDELDSESSTMINSTYPYLDLSIYTLVNNDLGEFLKYFLRNKYSNLSYKVENHNEISLFLENTITSENIPYLKIVYRDSILEINCSDEVMQQKIDEELKAFKTCINFFSILLDLHT